MSRNYMFVAGGLTVADLKKLIPDRVAIGKWQTLSINGRIIEYKVTWSNRYNRSYVHVRYFVPVYRNGKLHRNEYAYLRETKGGKWQEVS